MKKLGFGLMRLPCKSSDGKDIDLEKVSEMVDLFMSLGYTYFDTAYVYHGGFSEVAFRECVVKRKGSAGGPLSEGQLHRHHKAPAFL